LGPVPNSPANQPGPPWPASVCRYFAFRSNIAKAEATAPLAEPIETCGGGAGGGQRFVMHCARLAEAAANIIPMAAMNASAARRMALRIGTRQPSRAASPVRPAHSQVTVNILSTPADEPTLKNRTQLSLACNARFLRFSARGQRMQRAVRFAF